LFTLIAEVIEAQFKEFIGKDILKRTERIFITDIEILDKVGTIALQQKK
jgi:hypothetical protein